MVKTSNFCLPANAFESLTRWKLNSVCKYKIVICCDYFNFKLALSNKNLNLLKIKIKNDQKRISLSNRGFIELCFRFVNAMLFYTGMENFSDRNYMYFICFPFFLIFCLIYFIYLRFHFNIYWLIKVHDVYTCMCVCLCLCTGFTNPCC